MKRITILLVIMAGMTLAVNAQTRYVGGDISVLQSYDDNNVTYYDQNGSKINDVLKYMKSEAVGWNTQRVRLFVNPDRKAPNGSTDAQVCQDLDYVVRLSKRIKAEGFALMLDFHYSDTWADPANQWTPADWLSLTDEQLQTKIYEYTKACLQRLVDEGATPDLIQTGNEISYGMLWGKYGTNNNRCYTNSPEANWTRFINLLKQAVKACREVCPAAKIIIHSERAGKKDVLIDFFNRMTSVDYDIIGLSYYPFWHNSLSVLSTSLNELATRFPDKKVQIVETAYYYQWQPEIGKGIDYDFSSTWPVSAEGQAAFTHDLIKELNKHDNVEGLFWWYPEENGNGPDDKVSSYWVNRGLWDNNTHRALPALYVLKDFLGDQAHVGHLDNEEDSTPKNIYTLDGKFLGNNTNTLPHGIYIVGDKKTVK